MGGGGGLANADVIRGSLNADRGGGGVKFAKILLTSYVNAPLESRFCSVVQRYT